MAGLRAASVSTARDHIDIIEGVDVGVGVGGGSDGTGNLPLVGCTPESVGVAVLSKTALEGKVRQLRVRLAQERTRMLERRASAVKVTEEIERCERERARHAKMIQRRNDRLSASTAVGGEKGAGGSTEPRRSVKVDKGGEGLAAVASSTIGLSELMEREGEQFGKLQAKTIEMQQHVALLEKQETAMRANAARKAKATKAAIQEAVAKGQTLKEESEQREVRFTMAVRLKPNGVALSISIALDSPHKKGTYPSMSRHG